MENNFNKRIRYEYKELPTKGLIRSLEKIKPFDSIVIPTSLVENHDIFDILKIEIAECEKRINCTCISSKDESGTLIVFKPNIK